MRFIKFILMLLLIAGFRGAAFGATFTVTKTADTNDNVCDADCSLREAIAAANVAATDDVVEFDPGVFSSVQTITLTGGALFITGGSKLLLEGTGSDSLVIDCGVNAGVNINSPAVATFKNLKITGNISGTSGRIYSSGSLTLSNVIVMNSPTGTVAIQNLGNMTVENSSIFGNRGSAFYNNRGTLTISNSSISNNAGAIYNEQGMLTVNFFHYRRQYIQRHFKCRGDCKFK